MKTIYSFNKEFYKTPMERFEIDKENLMKVYSNKKR